MHSEESQPQVAVAVAVAGVRDTGADAGIGGTGIGQAPPPRTPDRPLGLGAAILTVVVTFVVSQIAGAVALFGILIVMAIHGDIAAEDLSRADRLNAVLTRPTVIAAAAVVAACAFIASTYVTLRIVKLPWLRSTAVRAPRALHVVLAVFFVLGAAPFADLLATLFQSAFPGATLNVLENLSAAARAPFPEAGLLIVAVSIGPGISEELFFRGLIQRSLVPRLGPAAGIALASVLFGAFHVDPPQAIGAAVLGAALGFVAYRAKSIVPSMVAHAANNAMALVLARTQSPDDAAQSAGATEQVAFLIGGAIVATAAGYALVRTTRQEP